jgi:hypothetical protein
LFKLPPSEAAFRQHILRVAFQVYVWTHANEAKPPSRSPLEYGWRNENKYLMPKYFVGPMTSDFLQDLVCICKGKSKSRTKIDCFLIKEHNCNGKKYAMPFTEVSC